MTDKKPRNSRKKLQYDIGDIGAMVAQHIEQNPKLSYQVVADLMGIGKAALVAKVKLPYFGTADTIAAASKILGVNLFEPFLVWLKKEGIPTNDEYANMKLLLDRMIESNQALEKKVAELEKINSLLLSNLPHP